MLHHQVYRLLNLQELSSLVTTAGAIGGRSGALPWIVKEARKADRKVCKQWRTEYVTVRFGLPGDALPLLQAKVFNKPVDMVIVMFGAEAAWDERRRQATELSPTDFQSQLNELVTAVQKESTKVVLMPPLLPDTRPDDVINRDRRIKSFAASARLRPNTTHSLSTA